MFLLIAKRGTGKGRFFSELSRHGQGMVTTGYVGQLFASLSFSCEVTSVWDMLTAFLLSPESPHSPYDKQAELLGKAGVHFPVNRRAALLRYALDQRVCAPGRLLVAFNAFDLLVEQDGQPKNAEIQEMLDALFGASSAFAAIDIVLIARGDRVPRRFRSASQDGGQQSCDPVLQMLSRPLHPARVSEPQDDMDEEALAYLRSCNVSLPPAASIPAPTPAFYVHLIRPESPGRLGLSGTEAMSERTNSILERIINASFSHEIGPPYAAAQLYRALGRNRFLLGCITRAANEAADPTVCETFLREILHAATIGASGREERVMESLLAFWMERAGNDLGPSSLYEVLQEIDLRLFLNTEEANTDVRLSDADMTSSALFEAILRHLAVIGIPVEADVLGVCPQIRQAIDQICGTFAGCLQTISGDVHLNQRTNDRDKKIHRMLEVLPCKILNWSLRLLVKRGLIFRVSGRQGVSKGGKADYRYSVHRLMCLHIYRRLGSQSLEPAMTNSFSISVYASQRSDLPVLTASAYVFLHELLDQLALYPGRSFSDDRAAGTHPRCLRGALGLTRMLFSIAVVSRFTDIPGLDRPSLPSDPGHLEHHRLSNRWLLAQAVQWSNCHEDTSDWPPFFRDEILWLYNECGVYSLAQGNVHDALALFEQALAVAREIEGSAGPLYGRIMLNYGHTAIDRGRLADAQRAFDQVLSMNFVEDSMKWIARGYRGQCLHLASKFDAAVADYDAAIEQLILGNELRAASVLTRHRGDLNRHRGKTKKAREDYDRAMRLAVAGGFQDVVQRTRVSESYLLMNEAGLGRQISARLDEAERYAQCMESPRLLSDVLTARAVQQLQNGETRQAGEYSTRALRIERLSGLRLRKLETLEIKCRIYRQIGRSEDSERLTARVLRSAREVGYHLLVERISTLGQAAE